MLNSYNYAQPELKSLPKRRLELVGNANQGTDTTNLLKDLNRATRLLQETIIKIDSSYAPSTIQVYRTDFKDFLHFYHGINSDALPVEPHLVVQYICKLMGSGRSSASIRRALWGLSAIHKLNCLDDPTKDLHVNLEMRRMHCNSGFSCTQGGSVNADILDKLLLTADDRITGIPDRTLLLVKYDTLYRRSESASQQVKDVKINIKNSIETSSTLPRKSKVNQDSMWKTLHLSQKAHLALVEWVKELPEGQEYIMDGIDRGGKISRTSMGAGQVNNIYKRIAGVAGLDKFIIKGIGSHSMRVDLAQDLPNSGASMPIITKRGRRS